MNQMLNSILCQRFLHSLACRGKVSSSLRSSTSNPSKLTWFRFRNLARGFRVSYWHSTMCICPKFIRWSAIISNSRLVSVWFWRDKHRNHLQVLANSSYAKSLGLHRPWKFGCSILSNFLIISLLRSMSSFKVTNQAPDNKNSSSGFPFRNRSERSFNLNEIDPPVSSWARNRRAICRSSSGERISLRMTDENKLDVLRAWVSPQSFQTACQVI